MKRLFAIGFHHESAQFPDDFIRIRIIALFQFMGGDDHIQIFDAALKHEAFMIQIDALPYESLQSFMIHDQSPPFFSSALFLTSGSSRYTDWYSFGETPYSLRKARKKEE